MSLSFNDFQKQNISFDINKLRKACDEVLKIKGFDTSLGIPHFAGIPLNQIPNDPSSIEGNKVRGVYWTMPDSTGNEVTRDVKIKEDKYTIWTFLDDINSVKSFFILRFLFDHFWFSFGFYKFIPWANHFWFF